MFIINQDTWKKYPGSLFIPEQNDHCFTVSTSSSIFRDKEHEDHLFADVFSCQCSFGSE